MARLVVDKSALLFYCAVITLSVVTAQPQQLVCPDGKLYGYVNETASGHDRELYVEVPAKDLQDCINRCFGNQFCYSLRYDASRSSAPCEFFYYSAYNCSYHELVLAADISYPGAAITVDCLRCPARGDFRAGSAGDFSVDEKEVTKPSGVGNFSEVPVIEGTTVSSANATETGGEESSSVSPDGEGSSNGTAGAETTVSVSHANDTETATVSPVEGTNASSEIGASAAPSIDETTGATVSGNETTAVNGTAEGAVSGAPEETTGASVTGEGSIDATPQSFTKSPSGPRQPCNGEIHFRPLERYLNENVRQPVFQNHTTAPSAVECARVCYELGCHLAKFNPVALDDINTEHTCQFAFESEDNIGLTEKTGCEDEEVKSGGDHSPTSPVALACIQCVRSGEETTASTNTSEPAAGEPENTTSSAGSGTKNTCDGDVYFLGSDQVDTTSKQFSNSVANASSAADCAHQCFEAGCEVAHYEPGSGLCMLTPQGATGIIRDCVLVHPSAFVKEYDAKQPIDISCSQCGQPVDQSPTTEQPSGNVTIESAVDQACTVTFQVDTERKTEDIEFRDIARVESIDQCASICNRDSCSLAVYDPPTTPDGKGYCKTQFKEGEVCLDEVPRVHTYSADKSVVIHCLRCSLEALNVTGAPEEVSTGWRAVTEATGSNETVSSETLISTEAPSACKITFQAVDGFAHSIDETVKSENATAGLTAAECAKECFEKKCVRAAHDPQSTLCLLSYPVEAETCLDLERVAVLNNDKQTWLQCIRCEPIQEKDIEIEKPTGAQIIIAHDAKPGEQSGNGTQIIGAESTDQSAVTESSSANVTTGPETNENATVVALPAEEGNATTVASENEGGNGTVTESSAAGGNETVALQPSEEGNVTTVTGEPAAGNETVVVQPAEEGNATTVTPVETTGNETVIVQPAEEGNATTVTPVETTGNETVIVQPSEEGNATAVTGEPSTGNETVVVQPSEEGNATAVTGEPAPGNETVVVQPAEEGNATTVTPVETTGNETVVVQPAEEGNATTVTGEPAAGNETVVIQPAEEGNATTVTPIEEATAGSNETITEQPATSNGTVAEVNVTTEVTIQGNETVAHQPAEEGNATTVTGEPSTGNETVIVQPSEEGNATAVTGEPSTGNETVVIQPAEEGNATTVTGEPSTGNETVVIQPAEEGNATTVTGEPSAGNETVVVQPGEEGNTTTVATIEGAPAGSNETAGNETVPIQPAIEGEPTQAPSGNETVTESSAGSNGTTEETGPAFVTEAAGLNETEATSPTSEPIGNATSLEAEPAVNATVQPNLENENATEGAVSSTGSEVETSTETGGSNTSESTAAAPTESLPSGPIDASLGNGCVVTFEFDPIDKKPAAAEGGFSSSTTATTAAICARRCYQDGCTGASYEPSSGTCLLTYGDYDSCISTEPTSIFKGTDSIWIRCARCQTNLPQVEEGAEIIGKPGESESEIASATEPTSEVSSSSSAPEVTGEGVTVGEHENATLETTTSGEVIVSGEGGNETTAQGEPIAVTAVNSDQSSSNESAVTSAPVAIAPAEENVTLAGGAESENITIAPQSEGEGATVQSVEATSGANNETAIGGAIDVTPGNVNKDEETSTVSVAPEGTGENATESLTPHGCVVSFEVAEPHAAFLYVNSSDEPSAGDCARRCFTTGCTVAGWEPDLNVCSYYFGEPAACANSRKYYNFVADRPVWLQCLKCEESSNVTSEASSSTEATTSGAAQSTVQACEDVVSFEVTQVGDIGFSSDQPAANVQECAKLCYLAGCKTAAFSIDPEPKCLMNFEVQNCSPTASRFTEHVVNSTDMVQIQCILCGYLTEGSSGAETTTASAEGTSEVSGQEGSPSNGTGEAAIPVTTALADGQVTDSSGQIVSASTPAGETSESTSAAAEGVTGGSAQADSSGSEAGGNATSENQNSESSGSPEATTVATSEGAASESPTAEVSAVTESAPSEGPSSGATGEAAVVTSEPLVVASTEGSAAAEGGAQESHTSSDKSAGCGGRLQFQVVAVNNMPHLNVTNDISASSPAECAKKCFDAPVCKMAGFIPSPSGPEGSGVCLLTTDQEICVNDVQFTPQHASLTPFVVSCLQCTPCNYQLSSATPDRILPDFEDKEESTSVSDCARRCSTKKCTMARFSAAGRSCDMTVSTFIGYDQCDAKTEQALTTDGPLPVLLQCVNCS